MKPAIILTSLLLVLVPNAAAAQETGPLTGDPLRYVNFTDHNKQLRLKVGDDVPVCYALDEVEQFNDEPLENWSQTDASDLLKGRVANPLTAALPVTEVRVQTFQEKPGIKVVLRFLYTVKDEGTRSFLLVFRNSGTPCP